MDKGNATAPWNPSSSSWTKSSFCYQIHILFGYAGFTLIHVSFGWWQLERIFSVVLKPSSLDAEQDDRSKITTMSGGKEINRKIRIPKPNLCQSYYTQETSSPSIFFFFPGNSTVKRKKDSLLLFPLDPAGRDLGD